jgi:hypothetical protein
VGLDDVKRRKIQRSCRESNPDSSAVQSILSQYNTDRAISALSRLEGADITGKLHLYICIAGISVAIAMGYVLDGWVRFLAGASAFLCSTASSASTQPPIQYVQRAVSPEVKQLGHEADRSLPSSAEFKNGRAILPLPHKSSWHSAGLLNYLSTELN